MKGGIVMKTSRAGIRRIVFILAIISIVAVVIDLVFLNFFSEILFKEPRATTTAELVVVIGAVIMGAFIIYSIRWVYMLEQMEGRWTPGKTFTIGYGVLCFFLLFTEKVMADQVGRQMLYGADFEFRLNVLHMLFVLQLIYALLILTEIEAQDRPKKLSEA